MARIKLTDIAISKLKSHPEKQIEYFDRLLPAFAVRVGKKRLDGSAGGKTYIVMVRVAQPDGSDKLKRIVVGKCHLISLADAREKAREIMRAAQRGEDPSKKKKPRQRRPLVMTVGDAAKLYFDRHTAHLRSGKDVEATIKKDLVDWWNDPLAEITRHDAAEIIDEKANQGKPQAAARLHKIIKAFFNWCCDEELLSVSPVLNYKLPTALKVIVRDRVLTADEIRIFWATVSDLESPFKEFYQLLLLTGQRREEVAGMRSEEIDLEEKVWELPPERNKSERPHAVPLSKSALHIVESLPQFDGPYVITTTCGDKSFCNFSKSKKHLDALLKAKAEAMGLQGFDEPWRIHDLRRTVRTEMSRLRINETVAERVINHGPQGLTKVYDKYQFLDEKREALDAWAQRVIDLTTPPPENVVSIRKRSAIS